MTHSCLREIAVLHLEPTDVCQAACPACARMTDPTFDPEQQNHLTVQQIQHHITQDQIRRLDKMFMCGVYGDPAAGRHTMEIYQYFRACHPSISLGMNTNGAIRTADWWQQLGSLFRQHKDHVIFSIDGLSDTNHVYRRNVDWHKLMENVQAYISTGASAHWDMLVYGHNEHQVDDCEKLAKKLGFRWFRVKVSRRPLVAGLAHPKTWHRPIMTSDDIHCRALMERSAYIDARGQMYPCCWLASRRSKTVDFAEIQASWSSTEPESTCVNTCGQRQGQSNFSRQWQREVELGV